MKLKEALEMFDEIVELCYETEHPRLIELVQELYPEITGSKNVEQIITALEEFNIEINNLDFSDEEEEMTSEIVDKINILSE